jgi:hypothetical protein
MPRWSPSVTAPCAATTARRSCFCSEISRRQAGVFSDTGEHSRPNFFVLVKCEHEVGPSVTFEDPVRAVLSGYHPTDI